MVFWLKFFHIAAVATWFAGLCLLPRALSDTRERELTLGRALYFNVVTPAAAAGIALGTVLILGYGFEGAWLPAKLSLVAAAVLLHLYLGLRVHKLDLEHPPLGRGVARLLAWLPLLLFLAIAALAAAKPVALDAITDAAHTPRSDGGR